MESQTKKNTRSITGLVKVISIIIFIVGGLVYIGISWEEYLDKSNKKHAIKIEQTHENIKIAEGMIEKELNVSSKYFKMLGTRIFLFVPEEEELNINTEAYWISKNITCKVQLNGESYSVTFETQRAGMKDEKIKMYKPVKINKIIKEQS
ncbi:hypothetical protein CN513_20545 [Bacillus cereus]|uniref:hypothetical protein n=1 Tax=Bacillus cereus TaxID=1396 RepID=UPI000BFA5C5E|nr:hypothetical protein [Bacillus cereus]PET15113.1 hypothetical protein CN513_20545 [Bacillus cereus]